MGNSFYSVCRVQLSITMAILLCSIAGRSEAQDYLVGLRAGTSFENNDSLDFRQVEAYAGVNLPWEWHTYWGLSFKPRVEGSAGILNEEDQNGFVGTLGPVIELRHGKFPVTFEFGASPTYLSKYNFNILNIGGHFEFTDHVGLNWHITEHVTVGWRFQHMSNAGIYQHNPGLNQQMLSASYRF
jgi:lipid A 3-O-deacylase